MYEGGWASGQQHGTGVFTDMNRKQMRGAWEFGKRIKWINEKEEKYYASNI